MAGSDPHKGMQDKGCDLNYPNKSSFYPKRIPKSYVTSGKPNLTGIKLKPDCSV